jgi:nicotinamidase-related amidase
MAQRVVVVVDMQQGVFANPRFDRQGRVMQINRLIDQADIIIFIQHREGSMTEGSSAFELLPELHQPLGAFYVTKTACDCFWQTTLSSLLKELSINDFVICGCATDYCVDTTVKTGASAGYHITVAADAHTTADRTFASAEQLIGQHNEVWSELSIPGNVPRVMSCDAILTEWQA